MFKKKVLICPYCKFLTDRNISSLAYDSYCVLCKRDVSPVYNDSQLFFDFDD